MVLLNTFDLESTLIFAFQVLWAVYFYKSNAVKKSLGEPYWIKNDDGSFYESPWVGANTVPPGTFSHNRGKAHRYCKLCGARLDSDCKCTGCGKQYFHINKSNFLKNYAVCLTAVCAVSIIWGITNNIQSNQIVSNLVYELDLTRSIMNNSTMATNREINPETTTYNDETGEYNKTTAFETDTISQNMEHILSKYAALNQFQDQIIANYNNILEKYERIESEYDFYHSAAVIVTESGSKYHKYGCSNIKDRRYLIYNIENAKGMGYTACADCYK